MGFISSGEYSRFKILDDLSTKLGGFVDELNEFLRKLWNSPKYKDVLKAMAQQNLEDGIRPDGTPIEKVPENGQQSSRYERYTRYLKEKKGKEYDHVNLYDTGAFYSGIDVKAGSDTLYIGDNDAKATMLIAKWGDVLGISENQEQIFIDMLYDEFLKFTKNYFTR